MEYPNIREPRKIAKFKMGPINSGTYSIGLLLRLNDIIHVKQCSGVTCMGFKKIYYYYYFTFG